MPRRIRGLDIHLSEITTELIKDMSVIIADILRQGPDSITGETLYIGDIEPDTIREYIDNKINTGTSFPPTPQIGQLFYRSDIKILFVWDGSNWTVSESPVWNVEDQTMNCNGINTIFTLQYMPINNSVFVFMNGLLRSPIIPDPEYLIDYNNKKITFVDPPSADTTKLIIYYQRLEE